MNDKKLLMDDEYIEFDFNDLDSKQLANKLTASSINETDKQLMNNLEDNFVQKCNLNQDEQEGDDEQTDDDLHQHQNGHSQTNQTSTLNSTTPTTQRRQRRKSANRSKINKILQSSLSSSTNMTNKLTNDNHLNTNVTKDQPQSSSSTTSLSSWIHLPNQQQEQQNHHFNHQLLTKEMMTKNLNSSYDTISEEELIRAKIKKRNQRSIDDDIVSSNVSSADDLPIDSFDDTNKQTETKLSNSDKKQINKQQSCDSLSSSPTNISYDSSPTKSISNLSITNNHTNKSMISTTNDTGIGKNQINHQKNLNSVNQMNQNKENQHLNRFNNTLDNGKQMHKHYNLNSINNKTNDHLITTTSSSIPSNVSTNQQQNQCINCHDHHCLNNNYLTFEQQNIPWLYDSISREDADKYLKRFLNVDGVFLVRTSSKIPDNFVLSFVHQQRVKHCHVRRLDVESTICYSIDDGKTKFFDIKSLIEFYQLNGYFLPTKLRFYLVRTN